MKRSFIWALTWLLISIVPLSIPAKAADGQSVATPQPEKIAPLRPFLEQGATINYLGRYHGLDGWVITKNQNLEVVYTTPDQQAGVVGLLYGPKGELETANQILAAKKNGLNFEGALPGASAAAPASQSPGDRLWQDVKSSTYFTIGPDSAPVLYIFVDPRCHYCRQYWKNLSQDYLPKNSVQLRLIPVGILVADSAHEAQQLVSTADKGAAWAALENGDLSKLSPTISADASQKIQANGDIMTRWKMDGTPVSVYRGKDGKVKLVSGLPNDVGQVIADLGKD